MRKVSTAICAAAVLTASIAAAWGAGAAAAATHVSQAHQARPAAWLARPMVAPGPAPDPGCAGADDPGAGTEAQEQAMLCLTNGARRNAGLAPLDEAAKLDRSAGHKSADIIRCDAFSHEACGHDFTYWMERAGYIPARCWRAGENIAWGTGRLGTAREIFEAWMRDPSHRQNILGSFRQVGIGLRIGGFSGRSNARVWTQQFGVIC
jgi:uncharacterized protein YkwD